MLFDRRAAWIAYGFAVTNVGLLVFAQFLLTEILLMLLLSVAIERFLVFFFTKRTVPLVGGGVALGLSCIVKAVAIPFLLPLVVLVILSCWRRQVVKKIILLLVSFA